MRIHVLGDAFCDIVAHGVTGLPGWGQGTRSSGIAQFAGGSALNTAVHLSSILKDKAEVVLFTALGENESDYAATVLKTHLKKHGVRLKAKLIANQPTGVCIVLSGQGDRAFVTSAGAITQFAPDDVDLEELANCDHLHLGGLYSLHSFVPKLSQVLADVRKRNPAITISMDTNFDETENWGHPWLMAALPFVDVLKQNEHEAAGVAKRYSGSKDTAPVTFLASKVRHAAVVTKGEHGAVFASIDNPQLVTDIPSPRVNPLDVCGAGDAWNAGFIAFWLETMREDVCAAVRFACACGAASVKTIGACEEPVTRFAANQLLDTIESSPKRPRNEE